MTAPKTEAKKPRRANDGQTDAVEPGTSAGAPAGTEPAVQPDITPGPEPDVEPGVDPDAEIELLVRAAERSRVARALIDAARAAGLPARVVRSTSTGYKVPARVADAADVALAQDVTDPGTPPSGTRVYAAASGRPGFRREGVEPVDPGLVPDPELPADLAHRGRGRRA